ncbi:sterol desaturase family protein [Reinekea sp. G2M2-21]|uniref:sterol desaturase family protein n=1 Tax=Reinekea sp. G2M2-21 TaxID=2788942 RepID=UPI0018AB1500|nr:sterol desaturase family protein [Reinekea sp. G2M2-21]
MTFEPQLILIYFAPIFLAFIAWEWLSLRKQAGSAPATAQYSLADTASNITLALLHEVGDGLAAFVTLSIYYWLFDFRLFDIPNTLWAFALLFVLQDFCYYWFHRASHRIRWMWASHVVHHSSQTLNFSTAFRQSLTYPISGMWVFWIPLVMLGFEPMTVIAVVLFNLAYQFFIHTQLSPKFEFLGKVLNTPSHHKVHHSRNAEYIDMNYAGTLIIWDKLFGTFIAEKDDIVCDFGITRQVVSHNPIYLTFHEWKDMFRDAFSGQKSVSKRLKHFWAPPEWQPEPAASSKTGYNSTEPNVH